MARARGGISLTLSLLSVSLSPSLSQTVRYDGDGHNGLDGGDPNLSSGGGARADLVRSAIRAGLTKKCVARIQDYLHSDM